MKFEILIYTYKFFIVNLLILFPWDILVVYNGIH